jgi:PAS domain S-box-containing protein
VEATYGRLLFEAPQPIYILDRAGRFLEVNAAGLDLVGRTREELVGTRFPEVIAASDREQVVDYFREIVSGQVRTLEFETWVVRGGGGRVLIRVSATAIREEGEVVGVHGIARDVTAEWASRRARERSETLLREQKELLETILENLPVMVAFFREDGQFEWVNRAWEEILGWSLEESRRRDILAECYPDEGVRAEVAAFMQASGAGWADFTTRTRSGESIPTRWANVHLPDGRSIGMGQDLSRLQETEEALRASEERFRLLVDSVRDYAIYTLDPEGRIATWNRGAEALHGRAAEEVVGRRLEEIAREDGSAARAVEALDQARAVGRWEQEGWEGRWDGERFWTHGTLTAVEGPSGKLLGFTRITRDLTERYLDQQRLARRDALLEAAGFAATRFLSTGSWRTELPEALGRLGRAAGAVGVRVLRVADGGAGAVVRPVVEWSGSGEASCSPWCAPAAVEELGLASLVPSLASGTEAQLEVAELPPSARAAFQERGVATLLLIPVHTRGRWWGVLMVESGAGEPSRGDPEVEVFRLVGRLLGAAVQRQEVEARLAGIVDSSMDAILCVDERLRIQVMNPAAGEMLGVDPEEALGGSVERFIPEASRHRPRERHRGDGEEAPTENPRGEVTALRADGTTLPVEATVVETDLGETRLYTVTLRDLTDQRVMEERLRQAHKMEAVGQLAGGVAHDFNNLLTVILGNVRFLEMLVDEEGPGTRELADIAEAAERSANLTRQLLAFSRRQVLRPRELETGRVVEELEGFLRRLIGEDVVVRTRVHGEPGRILADRGQFEQVLINLAVNARDAMPGGGRLELAVRDRDLTEPMETGVVEVPPGRWVEVTVRDTGTGMDAGTLARVFDPFFTTKEAGEGTGLGLSTVYGIVKQSEGFVWAESTPGEGSLFRILLPRAGVEADGDPVAAEDGSGEAEPGGDRDILLVEDEDTVRNLLQRVLERAGHRVTAVGTAESALAALEGGAPADLVLTDVVMPGMSGRDLASALEVSHPEIPVLYMSGYTDDAVLRKGIHHNEVDLIQKPVSPRELVRRVSAALERGPAAGSAS